ncbi:MAG: UDP-N-acetylmuramoyl-L-alanyl-D-glutamate--2,6-diaminopimelate ligase [Parachlamydiales bacterium]|jgi:UDP-N-acetylmuramoyl-L-alanyl-D-glutamate--2,6-diaminopimelate ligase
MKLKKILKNIPHVLVKGSKEVEITGLCSDSRYVAPGNLFVAKKGISLDGTQYVPEAIDAGAVAILTDLFNPVLRNAVQIIASDVAALEPLLAAEYYKQPDSSLFITGITGTNGKTTSSYMVKHFLDALQKPCGMIGTIECLIGSTSYKSGFTTPDIITNFKLLKEMVASGCQAVVMEVSSHGLEQKRVEQIEFDVGIFTNLSAEHLDYHLTMESYAKAKKKLFQNLNSGDKPKWAVINNDDAHAEFMREGCKAEVITYGLFPPADITAKDIEYSTTGIKGTLAYKNKLEPFELPFIGLHNIYNLLAATSTAICAGYSLEEIAPLAKTINPVQGRLERVPNPLDLQIYVDFAHKDIALRTVLQALRKSVQGRIITVFGCGGNRDKLKRPRMAKVCEELSDFTIVTSDNPRNEPPEEIIHQILEGFTTLDKVTVEVDRTNAIRHAIEMASPGDAILIAGKGHETQQIFAHSTIPFDDREVAYSICCAKAQNQTSIS